MTTSVEPDPAVEAGQPLGLPDDSWKAVGKRVMGRVKDDHVPLNAAGVAFFAFLAIIPALVAIVSLYGLVADPAAIEERVEDLAGALPDEARLLIVQQLEAITTTSDGALTIGLIVSLALALWSASSGMSYLVEAVNIAYRCNESRGFVQRRVLSLALTFGGLLFAVVAVGIITGLPIVLAATGLPATVRWLISLGVWPVVGAGLAVGLAVLYRKAPDREPEAKWRWVTPGSTIAVLAWLVASVGFQVYAANFGSYNETYGSLGAVVVMLLWVWISALVVLVGAEINAALEQETTAVDLI